MCKFVKRYYSLDIIKIVCTIIIVLHHFQQITGFRFSRFVNFYGGKIYFGYAVEMFFIISGVLTYKYIEIIRNREITFIDFFRKKAMKHYIIAPITVIAFAVFRIICKNIYNRSIDFTFTDVLNSSLLLHVTGWINTTSLNHPIWYISVLIFCYIIFYYIIILSSRYNINEMNCFAIMIILGLIIKLFNINVFLLNSLSYRGFVSFFWGLVLFNSFNEANNNKQASKALLVILYIFVIIIFKSSIQYTCLVFVLYPVLLRISLACNIKVFNKQIEKISSMTYAVYMWHTFFIELLFLL